jgi:hypothetical protein
MGEELRRIHMEEKTRGVALIATTDQDCQRRCDAALSEAGFRTVTAYSSHSVEYAIQHHDIDLFLFDAHIFASDPEERQNRRATEGGSRGCSPCVPRRDGGSRSESLATGAGHLPPR